MDLTLLLPASLVGAVVGFVVGLTANGSGALLTPALILGLGVRPSAAVATSVLYGAVTKFVASATYARRGAVDWRTVGTLAAGSVPGALGGALLLGALPSEWLDAALLRLIGSAVTLAGVATLWRLARPAGPVAPVAPVPPGRGATAGLGLGIGTLVGATSVGSGSVLMAVLVSRWPLPAASLVGTDLAHALLLSGAATLAHVSSGRLDLALSAAVLLGGLPGAWLGARLAVAVPERALRGGVAAGLVVAGSVLAIVGRAR